MSRRLALVVLALALPLCEMGGVLVAQGPTTAVVDAPWHDFEGRLTASGRRHVVATEGGGDAAAAHLSGSLVITRGDGLRRGFRVEAIGFEEASGGGVGRAVWIDDAGDRVFSRLVGLPVQAGRRTSGTITGGTGRYAGISGTYTFTWQYALPDEQGAITARTTSFVGRYRPGSAR